MVLATLSDYVGFSILWAMPFLNASKAGLMLRSVSQTLSGRPLDITDNRDKRLEEKVKEQIGAVDVKILEAWNPYYVYVSGVNLFKKRAIMVVIPGLDLVDKEAFDWLYKRESYYVINRSFLKIQIIKALSITISAILFNVVFGYAFFSSIFYTILIGFGIDMLCSHVIENRADSFSFINSSVEELKGAVRFLKVAHEEHKKKSLFQVVVNYLVHSSFPFRMRRVKKVLTRQGISYVIGEESLIPLRQLLEKNNLEEKAFIEAKKQQVLRWIDADED